VKRQLGKSFDDIPKKQRAFVLDVAESPKSYTNHELTVL